MKLVPGPQLSSLIPIPGSDEICVLLSTREMAAIAAWDIRRVQERFRDG